MAASLPKHGAENGGVISAAEFWRYYFEGRITQMVRAPGDGYRGNFIRVLDTAVGSWPGEEVRFFVPHDELVRYDYSDNPRFSTEVYKDFSQALSAVISARLMQRETIPNISQLRLAREILDLPADRNGGSYSELRSGVLRELAVRDVHPERAFEALRRLKPNDVDYQAFAKDGDLDHLHVQRELLLKSFGIYFTDSKVCCELQAVIDNRSCEYLGTVELAIWALGRQNDKGSIAYLTNLLAKPVFERSIHVIERALQFVCSGEQLIPLSSTAPPIAYWLEVKKRLPATVAGWVAHDANSVLWEKRLRRAKEWAASGKYLQHVEHLRSDEVVPVRVAAKPVPARDQNVAEIPTSGNIGIKISNGTRLDFLDLRRQFGAAVAALASPASFTGAVPTFGEQATPEVVLVLPSTVAPAFVAWVQKQRTLGRAGLQIIITNERDYETTVALSDSRYTVPNAELNTCC